LKRQIKISILSSSGPKPDLELNVCVKTSILCDSPFTVENEKYRNVCPVNLPALSGIFTADSDKHPVQFACMQSQQGITEKFQKIQTYSRYETQFFENNGSP
jgi:hypothetical protein